MAEHACEHGVFYDLDADPWPICCDEPDDLKRSAEAILAALRTRADELFDPILDEEWRR